MTRPALGPHAYSPVELKAQIEAEREGDPFLVYRDGDGGQRIIRLGRTDVRLTVGRNSGADVALTWDDEASRLHALLERVTQDWTLVDDGLSRNGSWVNGERLSGRRRLVDGDRLRFGDTLIIYRAPGGEGADDATVSAQPFEPVRLTDTQRRVLIALCRPFKRASAFAAPPSNQQIADELVLSIDAVKTHLRTLFAKFGVEDLPQNQKRLKLIERVFDSGLISERDL